MLMKEKQERIKAFIKEREDAFNNCPYLYVEQHLAEYNALVNRYNNPVKFVRRTSRIGILKKLFYYSLFKRNYAIKFVTDDNKSITVLYYKVLFKILMRKITKENAYENIQLQILKQNNIEIARDYAYLLRKRDLVVYECDYTFLDTAFILVDDLYPDESSTKVIIV